jgi:hypothetical protein
MKAAFGLRAPLFPPLAAFLVVVFAGAFFAVAVFFAAMLFESPPLPGGRWSAFNLARLAIAERRS